MPCRGGDFARLAQDCVQARQDVGQRADGFFDLPLYQLNGFCIQAGAGQLGEVTALRRTVGHVLYQRQIDSRFVSALDRLPG